MSNYHADERNRIVATMAAQFVHYDRTHNATLRNMTERDGIHIACDGRTMQGGEKAWRRAVALARKEGAK